ncbi:hypothetical protein CC85DRAFT_287393 [Cutaneotrichosporon oleaginosum]|uniref:Uncharacterized protein n=1 Tax=Cutaneotrichosporon oleaginosum TaxID=879819 RepID=A0A0J0XHE4_9TREE|nr:uncharacterized protein CC85DRAFT_287393 [Cutaneotrichosporon oleaginosum]KLT40550.1 hypothetical protein CC85DRAFT_287393 [Cutaneotrichosporon oleaginosum]TXT08379.1 hypothetical protein COLE_05303 [Cutaneotrichosporon oleaginosum]
MSRFYGLVPLITLAFFAGLIALVTWGWPPSDDEKDEGQAYPHPFFWKAFLVGTFASMAVQSLRVPMFILVSWLPLSGTGAVFVSTVAHVIVHEACRLVSVPLTVPSITSGFHSSYWLGLGWGVAEAAWGIVQGYEQLNLYEDLSDPWAIEDLACQECNDEGLCPVPEDMDPEDEAGANDDLAELEHRVEILERMRARAELEDVMGLPFPLIPFALHVLWRIDTLILNLGLTLILSGFYFDPEPIYKHEGIVTARDWPPIAPKPTPSRWLPLAWVAVTLVHITLSLVWKVVGRVGVGAVTWGGLIVALGSVFAGLGVWGGVV